MEETARPDEKLSVTFINVGKGTSIFINGTDGQSMLIDAGMRVNPPTVSGGSVSDHINDVIDEKLDPVSDSDDDIDYLVVTHNDQDHYEYIDDLNADVETVYHQGQPDGEGLDTYPPSYSSEDALKKGMGDTIDLGNEDIEVDVYHPQGTNPSSAWDDTDRCGKDGADSKKKTDCNSIVIAVKWDETKFVFPSDIRANTKLKIWNDSDATPFKGADVIQVAHHGSKHSLVESGEGPLYCRMDDLDSAVISNTRLSSRGPDAKVLKALGNARLVTYWTAVHRDVEYVVNDDEGINRVKREDQDGDSRSVFFPPVAWELFQYVFTPRTISPLSRKLLLTSE